jgi:hypothetical protein
MITISTTSEDEARDVADVLGAMLPPGLGYRIFLRGHEVTCGAPPGPGSTGAEGTVRTPGSRAVPAGQDRAGPGEPCLPGGDRSG